MTDEHPRLYFDRSELAALRACRDTGHHAVIWRNLAADAQRYTSGTPPLDWIAPQAVDPRYENLYDRFYAMMSDSAIVEQLAFASAYGDDDRLDAAAVSRLLAACTRWRPESGLPPDYGTAYATTRVLKAIAIGYDLLYQRLDAPERDAVREMLTTCARRLAHEWFSRPDVRGPVGVEPGLHSPHHSSVEWSAFGIVALSLVPEVDEAAAWVDAAATQFAGHLVRGALAADGTQPEGNEFWTSTVLSQFQFLDPLRRGTGRDLLTAAVAAAQTHTALAIFRPHRERSATGEPIYGDSTGMSALLLGLARERRDGSLRRLAMAEPTTGRMEVWPARTPRRGEQMRIAPGGYAFAWYRPDLPDAPEPEVSVQHFPVAREAYLRTGWGPDDALVAVRDGKVSVHLGERLVFEDLTPSRVVDLARSREAGTGIYRLEPPDLVAVVADARDERGLGWVRCVDGSGRTVATVRLDRPRRRVVIDRLDGHRRIWAYDSAGAVTPVVEHGRIEVRVTDGHRVDRRVGYGLLDMVETDPLSYPTMTVVPVAGHIRVRIDLGDGDGSGTPARRSPGSLPERN